MIIGALVSDRLRRRDDIADALGTSVNLSVGRSRQRRAGCADPAGRAGPSTDLQRIVA